MKVKVIITSAHSRTRRRPGPLRCALPGLTLLLSGTAWAGPTAAPTDAGSAPPAAGDEAGDPADDEDDGDTVTVYGTTPAEALRRSAHVVTVVETEEARREAADLGEVLARKTPVTVQRASGLGSRSSLSLGGLGGERLRFFIDDVPLELMGYLAGTANVPVNLVDRVEVYQGAVPVRLAGDALGGAVNLATDQEVWQDASSLSYQFGSFDTHRVAASGRAMHVRTGLFVQASAFHDRASNDYDVDVEAYDDVGRIVDVTVPLFHSAYRGTGAHLSTGVAGLPWADRLVLQGFVTSFHNDVQNGSTMERPYGEVTFDRWSAGANLRYTAELGPSTRLSAIGGTQRMRATFQDLSSCIYDWYGVCTPRSVESLRGEISGTATDRQIHSESWFLRSTLEHGVGEDHLVRVAVATTHTVRTGESRTRSAEYDPLAQPRRLTTGVAGVELESSLLDGRLKNVASAKGYGLDTDSQALLSTGEWKDMSARIVNAGAGDSLRLAFTSTLSAKASYEYATRQPSLDELYGDGGLVLENLELRPENSHNLNASLHLDALETDAGTFTGSVGGFSRHSTDLIARLSNGELLQSVNIFDASAVGVESRLSWTTPGSDWLSISGRATWQDLRNRSTEGDLGRVAGDRIPNLPYLFGNGAARVRGHGLVVAEDTLELGVRGRYVHEFQRGWESLGQSADRLTIDSQLTFGLSLVYLVRRGPRALSTSLEVENLTNARTFDFYGLQRPGRAFFTKWTFR